MADLRDILDVKSLKAPTRPLKELLRESTAQAKDDIVAAGRSTDGAHLTTMVEQDQSTRRT